jgi:hypothetical protein
MVTMCNNTINGVRHRVFLHRKKGVNWWTRLIRSVNNRQAFATRGGRMEMSEVTHLLRWVWGVMYTRVYCRRVLASIIGWRCGEREGWGFGFGTASTLVEGVQLHGVVGSPWEYGTGKSVSANRRMWSALVFRQGSTPRRCPNSERSIQRHNLCLING